MGGDGAHTVIELRWFRAERRSEARDARGAEANDENVRVLYVW